MTIMKFGVVIFPGSNCDEDMIYVLENIMQQKVERLWHKDSDLKNVDVVVLPGGFSYGDYLRSGALAKFSPIMQSVIDFADAGGYVFGVCNGFQILCETGLLPGALLHNNNQKFICKNTYIVAEEYDTFITSLIGPGKVLKIPIAHGEGRYFATEPVLKEMRANKQIIFRYCSSEGKISNEVNPNGSVENIAGICNVQRNVFGMMPHPERASDKELGNTDGKIIFESMIKMLQ
ncbi:MAG: phosphoribosylformylglycinamidine synthase subunit PurQ [Marinilabiliales bacterium]